MKFGLTLEVGVDENILVESSEESIIEVMNGCICCTVRGDLTEVLNNMHDRIKDFDGVIIETTGLADPAPVAQTFFADKRVAENYNLDGIITVVDAKHIIQHLDDEKPEGIENESVEQLAFADRIMLNKIDLVDEDELANVESRIKSINGFAPIFHTENSIIDPKELINIGAFDLEKTLEMDPEFLDTESEHEHDDRVTSTSMKFEGELNVNKLERYIGKLMREDGENLFTRAFLLSKVLMKNTFSKAYTCCLAEITVETSAYGRKEKQGNVASFSLGRTSIMKLFRKDCLNAKQKNFVSM